MLNRKKQPSSLPGRDGTGSVPERARYGRCAASTNGRGLCMACRSNRGATDQPDEANEQKPVQHTQYDQEDQVRQAQVTKDQVHQRGKQDIPQCDRYEYQPGELHKLVGTQARQRAAHPDEYETQEVDVAYEVEDAQDVAEYLPAKGHAGSSQKRDTGTRPAAQEECSGNRRNNDHIAVFAEVEHGPAHAAILGEIARNKFRFRLWQVKRCTIRFGQTADVVDNDHQGLHQEEPGPGRKSLEDEIPERSTLAGPQAAALKMNNRFNRNAADP